MHFIMDIVRELIRFSTQTLWFLGSILRLFRLDKLWNWLRAKSGRRLPGLSLPTKAAWATFFFLLVCVGTFFLAAWKAEGAGPIGKLVDTTFIAVTVGLVLAIPIVVYKLLKLYLEGEGALYPDIEEAFELGLEELQRQRIDIKATPLFLILGCNGETQAQSLFEGSQMELSIKGFPTGKSPIYWFASAEGVYLVASEAGAECLLAKVAKMPGTRAAAANDPSPAAPKRDIRSTLVANDDSDLPAARSGPPNPAPALNIRGTMEVANVRETMTGPAATGPMRVEPTEQRIVVDRGDRERELSRLEYLCRRINRARKPFCPVNGVMVLLPYKVLDSTSGAGEMSVAISNDLRVANRVFMQRFPVVGLVVGLEEERGFQELVRRVGQAAAAGQRFGHKFDPWKTPLPEQMEALCSHACGAFEDWVYSLFRKDDALKKKTGNELLYSLLCKIRGRVQLHLEKVLAEGFGYDPDQKNAAAATPVLFAGCYFAATGEREDRRAFVSGVLRDKLADHVNDVEWMPQAIDQDRRCRSMANAFVGIDILLAAALIFVAWVAFR